MRKHVRMATDHPRFQPVPARADTCHRHYHGGPQVELVFRLADWWLHRCAERAHAEFGVNARTPAKVIFPGPPKSTMTNATVRWCRPSTPTP
jgi:hypothetical protein